MVHLQRISTDINQLIFCSLSHSAPSIHKSYLLTEAFEGVEVTGESIDFDTVPVIGGADEYVRIYFILSFYD